MSDRMRYVLIGVTVGMLVLAWGSLIALFYAFDPLVAAVAVVASIGAGMGLVFYELR